MKLELSRHPSVILAYLFGSQAKGKASEKSDVDIAVFLQEPLSDSLQIKLDLLQTLQEAGLDNVDLTILNEAGSVLKYQVVKHGQLLFEREKGNHKKFQIAAWKEYFDFQPTLEYFYRRKIA